MTEQHPLTDDVCFDLVTKNSLYCDDMRSAADWQLEQVKKAVEHNLTIWRESGYGSGADAAEDFFEEVVQQLRPQQQEDN